MSTKYVMEDSSGVTLFSGDKLVVAPGGRLIAEDTAVRQGIVLGGAAGTISMRVDGYVFSHVTAVSFFSPMVIVVGDDGLISGNFVIRGTAVEANLKLTNYGIISANADLPAVTTFGQVTLNNHGTIEGNLIGYSEVAVDNHWSVVNSGKIIGNIYMSSYNDTYTAIGQGQVLGTISGGEGNDTFTVGRAEEEIDGGAGNDQIVIAGSAGVSINLKTQIGTGVAANDLYTSIETLYGSAYGNDTLAGTASRDYLYGRGGDDLLRGAEGGDKLSGGTGADVLIGQSGADTFAFRTVDEGGDRIVDFALFGDDDNITIDNAGFDLDLDEGVLAAANFRANSTGAAGDADDRFIYRTTDNTVWYDPDGTGVARATMIADLQAGAKFTAADIIIV